MRTVQELSAHGSQTGEYKEIRDIVFSPEHERTERFIGKPSSTLTHLKLTEEDFRDIREVQPFLLTKDQAFIYETRFRGEETMDGIDCWLIQIRPRQILQGQRLFDGMLWVDKKDWSIIRSEGEAVPQIFEPRKPKTCFHTSPQFAPRWMATTGFRRPPMETILCTSARRRATHAHDHSLR